MGLYIKQKGKETEADIMGFFDRPLFDFNGDGKWSVHGR